MLGNLGSNAMIDLNHIPNSDEWGEIDPVDYYPDNYHEIFLGISCNELIDNVNKPNGIGIISSLSSIPLRPFYFYTFCILRGIFNKDIPLTNYFSEFYFDNMIWAIEYKFNENPSLKFLDFIELINNITHDIKNDQIATTYSQEEKDDIFKEANQLITKIRKLV